MTEQKWTLVVSTTFVVLLLQVVWSVTNDLYLKNVSQRACKSKGYTSQSLKEGNYSYVESTNGPWMNPGQAINYVTWHRISAVTHPCLLVYALPIIFFLIPLAHFSMSLVKNGFSQFDPFRQKWGKLPIIESSCYISFSDDSLWLQTWNESTDWVNISLSVKNTASLYQRSIKIRGLGIFLMTFGFA